MSKYESFENTLNTALENLHLAKIAEKVSQALKLYEKCKEEITSTMEKVDLIQQEVEQIDEEITLDDIVVVSLRF